MNDCGEPKGGFEWAGEYNVTITKNAMKLQFHMGLGDPLERHTYRIKLVQFLEGERLVIKIQNYTNSLQWIEITFNFVENDTIWNEYHNYYIAYYVIPTIFEGFKPHYYVEIRLKEAS
mgnify:CR=1 FL=1